MNLIGNINAIPFRRFRGGGGVAPIPPFPSISGMIARYSALGLTNEQMAENPVWVDKTGNGHDIQLKNFSWKGMSGVGGYVQNFNDFRNNATVDKIRIDEQGSNSIKVTILTTGIGNAIYIPKNIYQFNKSYFIKISSEGYDEGDMALSFYAPSTSTATTVTVSLNPNGITEIPAIKEDDFLAVYINVSGKVGSFTVEQLPLYPGALVFDGVDDYGVCDNFPIPTKEKGYTVVALRQWITRDEMASGLVSNVKDWFNDGAFLLEYRNVNANYFNRPVSFGTIGSEKDLPHILTYQTSKSYNGVSIITGNFTGTDVLYVGKLTTRNVGICINAAIWELVFLDHDATEEELTKIKEYFVKTYPWLFPDQAWTVTGKTNEDEDRATIANITGNGNDLVLSNFAFSGNSGYGEYAYNFSDTSWISISDYGVISDKTSKSFNIKSFVLADYPVLYTAVNKDSSIKKVKIKVTNSIPGFYFGNKPANQIIDLSTDGIYEIPSYNSPNDVTQYGFRCSNVNDSCNITIEQIPEYEGYLVTDGVDDKIESKQPFQLPIKFSMIGSWVFIKKEDKRAGISKENNLIVYDKITGLTLFLNSVESYEEIDIDSFHAISSDGKLYDENWNMLPITVGSLLSDSSTLKIAYDGNNFVQFAFNCMGFYDKILKKDDLLKGWIYLKGLKAQRIPPSKNYILKEDGGYVLQEDGNKILTEQQ